jgi:hypothetical protein
MRTLHVLCTRHEKRAFSMGYFWSVWSIWHYLLELGWKNGGTPEILGRTLHRPQLISARNDFTFEKGVLEVNKQWYTGTCKDLKLTSGQGMLPRGCYVCLGNSLNMITITRRTSLYQGRSPLHHIDEIWPWVLLSTWLVVSWISFKSTYGYNNIEGLRIS